MIFKTINVTVFNRIKLKYLRFAQLGSKDIGIRKIESVVSVHGDPLKRGVKTEKVY